MPKVNFRNYTGSRVGFKVKIKLARFACADKFVRDEIHH